MKTIKELLDLFNKRESSSVVYPVALQMAYVAGACDMAMEWGGEHGKGQALELACEAIALVGVLGASVPEEPEGPPHPGPLPHPMAERESEVEPSAKSGRSILGKDRSFWFGK